MENLDQRNLQFILLRGLTRDQRHWDQFPQRLEQAFPGAQILPIDLPGVGLERASLAPRSIEENTDFIRQRIKVQLGSCTNVLVSISMGAMVALDWIHRFPEEMHGIVMINSSASNLSSWRNRIRPTSVLRLLASLVWSKLVKSPERLEREILIQTTRLQSNVLEERVRQWSLWAREWPVSLKTVLNQLKASSRFHAPAQVKRPVLILASDRDQLVSADCSAALKKNFESTSTAVTKINHPSAGHDLPLDDPEWVIERLKSWLKDSESTSEQL